MATITQENARQIRDPMQVYFDMDVSSNAKITNYNVGTNKSYDSTLGNVPWDMRILADLEGEGFLLDGTAEWYEDKEPSADNGRLGARGVVDQNLTIRITLDRTAPSVMVATEGVSEIRVGSTVYQATGLDVIATPSRTVTMVFVPDEEHGRAAVKYIYPGAKFEIRNDNLIRAELNLRCSLDPFADSLEASDIEIQMHYPNDIGDILKYIGDDWPILYQAGYTNEKSFLRKFYLTDATWSNRILTIRGTDAVNYLDVTLKEGDPGLRFDNFLDERVLYIVRSFVEVLEKYLPDGLDDYAEEWSETTSSTGGYAVRPETSLRDYLQKVANYTRALPQNIGAIGYVDAGRPRLIGSKNSYLFNRWTINETDLGDIVFTKIRNIAKIETDQSTNKFNEIYTSAYPTWTQSEPFEATKGSIIELDNNGGFSDSSFVCRKGFLSIQPVQLISWTPSGAVYKVTETRSDFVNRFLALIPSGGTTSRVNPNGLPGDTVQISPVIFGSIIKRGISMFDPVNLMKVNRDTIEFTYKGDPRWQPYDLLKINRLDGETELKTRIASINLVHEGGGTMARVVAKLMSDEELEGVDW